MPAAKVTSKGQVTIPKEVRQALGVEPGDRVSFVLRSDGVVELVARTGSLLDLAGVLGERRLGVTVDDMDAAISAEADRRFSEGS
jgi:AbrB family looped-hinge helix DNA binding protein